MSKIFSEFLGLVELRGACWCHVEIAGAGGFNLYQGDDLFFYFVLEGIVRLAGIGGAIREIGAGEGVIVLSGEPHAVRSEADARTEPVEYLRDDAFGDIPPSFRIGDGSSSTRARLLCGRLKARWPSGLARKALPAAMLLGPTDMLLDTAAIERAGVGSGACAVLTRIASLFLTSALRRDPQAERLFLFSATNDPIARAVQLIERHWMKQWTVSMLAASVGMGRSNFAARFMAEVGRTPMDVLAEQRMRIAADLLEAGELKILEVGARVGYQSEAAFSRRFSRHFGMSPGTLRSKTKRRERRVGLLTTR